MKVLIVSVIVLGLITPAFAMKSCPELMSEIDAKIQPKPIKAYSLSIVPSGKADDGKVVGTCERGTKSIIYKMK